MNEFEKKCRYGHKWMILENQDKAVCKVCNKEQILDYSNEV